MNEKIEKIEKYLKYSKLLIKTLIEEEPILLNATVLAEYKMTLQAQAKQIKKVKNTLMDSLSDDLIFSMTSAKTISTFARMIEYSEFRNDKDRISLESILSGIELHQDKEFMILPDLAISINSIWFLIQDKTRDMFISCYDHMYFHALQFIVLMGGYGKFEDTQVPFTQFDSKIAGACQLAKYIMGHSIDTHKRIDDKSGAIDATNKIINSLTSNLEKNGIMDTESLSAGGAFQNPDVISSVNDFRGDIKTMIDNKDITKDQLIDVSLGAFAECKKMGNGVPHETQIILNTFATVCKEKAEKDPKIKNNRHAMKFIDEIVETYYNKDLPIDEKAMKKMEKKMRKGKTDFSSMFGDLAMGEEKKE